MIRLSSMQTRTFLRHIAVFLGLILALSLTATESAAQGLDPEHRPIDEVRIEGLKVVSEQLVLNQIRSKPGEPYNADTVSQDIVRLTFLGRFEQVTARIEPREDGAVTLIFDVVEQAILTDVQVVGNKADRKSVV